MTKIKISVLIFIAAFSIATFSIAHSKQKLATIQSDPNVDFYQLREAYNELWPQDMPVSERKGWKQFKRWEYFWEQRVYPSGKFPDAVDVVDAMNKINNPKDFSNKPNNQDHYQWNLLGPVDSPNNFNGSRAQGLGRVNVIRFHPTLNSIWYAGAATGGIWKTSDSGKNWENLLSDEFLSIGISDIRIAETNPNIVYAATGDADGSSGSQSFYAVGVIKSTDAGQSWSVTNLAYQLHNAKLISRILLHPANPNIVYAATNEGILRTKDGGNNWETVFTGGYFRDLEFSPENPNIIYASTFSWSGETFIYRSMDGGDNWENIKTMNSTVRIELAVTKRDSYYLYAVCANNGTRGLHSVLRSTDIGETWETVFTAEQKNLLGWHDGTGSDIQGQGQYDLALAVSPWDENELYIGGINVWKSVDGGRSWEQIAHWYGRNNVPFVHADHHELTFHHATKSLFSCHDGGLSKTDNKGGSWTDLTDGLSITQYYRLGSSATNPSMVLTGAQDNGTTMLQNDKWLHIYAGDGMECAVDPSDENRVYVSLYYGSLFRSTNGGASFRTLCNKNITKEEGAWVTPYVIAPSNPSIIYAGYYNVWKLSNYGDVRTKISDFSGSAQIKSLAVSPTDENIIYAATNGVLHVSYDGGGEWTKLLNSNSAITYISVDPENPYRIWVSKSGYNSSDKLWEYDGENWINLSGNLPNVPVNCVVYQNNSPDRLYVGTDIGVFTAGYSSGVWEKFGSGLPNVIVNELEINYLVKKIRAATYGRGLWEAPLNTCNLEGPEVSFNGKTELCEGDSLILTAAEGFSAYHWNNGETTRTITVKESGAYSVTIFDDQGCSASSQVIEVTFETVRDVTVDFPEGNTVCEGDSIAISADFGFSEYHWSNGDEGRKIYVSKPGIYYVRAYASNGCSSVSEQVEVHYLPGPEKPDITRDQNLLSSTVESHAYQWYLNGIPIDGANEISYLITEIGVYKVEVSNEENCSSFSDDFPITTSADDYQDSEQSITVFPNPGNGLYTMIYISNASEQISLHINNSLGQKVYEKKFTSEIGQNIIKIDLGKFPVGVYYLILFNGNDNFKTSTNLKTIIIQQ